MKTSFLLICLLSPILALPQKKIILENLGAHINSKYDEVSPLISADGKTLYFIRNDYPENIFGTVSSQEIWVSTINKKTGKWTEAKRMAFPFNQRQYNAICGISTDGNTLIIKGAYKKGKYKGRGISLIKKTKKAWSKPQYLAIEDYKKMSVGIYEGAYLCNDGKTLLLYFSEKKGEANADIYVSFLEKNGKWSRPVNLGNTINTPYMEACPFLASDGVTLYFSSTKPGGFGNADIYRAKRLDDSWKKWSLPENMGDGINSEKRENYYSLAASGDYAFMVTNPGKYGKADIVKVKVAEEKRPEPVVLISGNVLNAITKEPIEASIKYQTLPNGRSVGVAEADPESGTYKIVLPKGKLYAFSASAPGYMAVSEHIDLQSLQTYEEIEKNLLLVPIEKGQTIRLNNIFFESGSAVLKSESFPELTRLTQTLKKYPAMEIEIAGHTDSTGNSAMNQKLSKERAKAVMQFLVNNGINNSRITAKGYGASKPIANNATEEGKAQNRRVEFVILKN